MKYLAAKNFEEFQHYTDRTPPWIKLYNSLLDDYAFLSLSDSAQINLVKLWLLASRHHNRIPYDLPYITGKLLPKSALDIDELIVAGFLYFAEDAASPEMRKREAKSKKRKRLRRKPKAKSALEQRKHGASTVLTPRERESERQRESKKKKQPGGWVGRFGDARVEIRGGVPGYPEIGRELKVLVDRDGEEEIYPVWLAFLRSEKAQFGAAYFAKNLNDFKPRAPKLVQAGGLKSSAIEW